MPLFIDTRGKSTVAIALCDRCKLKFPYDELQADPNSPGLRVCAKDLDLKDPYRLPPRKAEKVTLRYPRLEDNITTTDQSTYSLIKQDTNINLNDATLKNGK